VDDEELPTNEGILLLRDKQEEIIAPYFIDLALELSQFTSWCCSQEFVNIITRTCKSLQQRNEINLLQQKRKTRPQPWRDDYLDNGVQQVVVRSSSVAE
jgi:hypothetical protein